VKTITQLSAAFPVQSYFDSVLLQTAILSQPPGDSIIGSTLQSPQTPGYGVALHPSSETPIAIRFFGERESGVVILTPGSVLMVGPFDRFEWGLPFGWLGGGLALLYVLHQPDVKLDFSSNAPEIIFHRTRVPIEAFGAITNPVNWPVAFPWGNAFSGSTPQDAAPVIAIQPTKTFFRLRVNGAAPVTLAGLWRATSDFDTDSAGVVTTTEYAEQSISFPASSIVDPSVFPTAWIDDPVTRLGGDDARFNLVDPTGVLAGSFVDVVRYGRIQ